MNEQLIEMWGRWMTQTLRSQNYLDIMNGWWFRSMKDISSLGQPYASLWGAAPTLRNASDPFDGWQQVWHSVSMMQQMMMQWVQMVPRHKYGQLEKHAQELETKVREQARTIDHLRNLLNKSVGENNVVVTQLQELIGQQSEQFKQMTQNVSEYLKSSAEKVSAKK